MAESEVDRNLLFAAIALQDDLIDQKQLAEVCAVWALRMGDPLADILVERGWITADDRREVERKLERKLKKHEGNARETLGLMATADFRDIVRQVDHPQVRQSLSSLPPAAGYLLVETLVPHGETRSRYTLSRLHAEGGLGKVWLAHDTDLNREVALKEIKPEQAMHPEAWRRFLKEAQVTGQLEHPNIVPVYELARRSEDGQPFYTMRFVRGRTFREAIADYHERRVGGKADPVERLRLLQAFVGVCQAIAYAHSRGVVHRDLKPDNIVLGGFGEVIVLDWGLAKMVDRPDEPDDLPGVSVGDDAQTEATRAGQQLGTPAYMAPEQAEGRSDLIDGRTNVYGLGAILFEILTGRAPHNGKSVTELLRQIIVGETPRSKSVEPSVAAALDAICARAMAKKRAERYGKASDLAEDVQRWLADEPVRAYREPLTVRLGRMARRHRTAFVGASALLVAAVVALSIGTILLGRANERTALQRDRARANLHKALVASLGKDIEAGLSATDGSVDRLNALEKVVDDLGRLEPAQAAAARRRVYRRFAQSNEESLRRPALRPGDVAAIEHSVALLETRAPDEIPALRRSLRERLQAWEPIVDLAAPYRSLDAVFDLSQVRVGADGVHPQESSGSDTPTTIPARGNLRCEANFAAGWESATSLGLTIRVTPGHTGEVKDLAYSPDGSLLASGGTDAIVFVWDLAKRQSRFQLSGHRQAVSGVAFSPDGRTLASADGSDSVRLWDVATGRLRRTLQDAENWVGRVAFSPDGRLLACGSTNGRVVLRDASSGQTIAILDEKPDWVNALAFSPNGSLLAVGTDNGSLKLWDVAARRMRAVLPVPRRVVGLAFHPDGTLLASSHLDPGVRIWDVASGQLRTVLKHGEYSAGKLAFSRGGTTLAVAVPNGDTLQFWETSTWRRRASVTIRMAGLGPLASPSQGNSLALGCWDGTIRLWDALAAREQGILRDQSYTFLLNAEPPTDPREVGPPKPLTLGSARETGKTVRLEILRNAIRLQNRALRGGELPRGPLSMRVSREGNRLTVQIDPVAPLEIQDAFPLGGGDAGMLALRWPGVVALERFRVSRQALATVPSPLERGDDLYGRGRFDEAVVAYQEQAVASGTTTEGQEARYKLALCLTNLDRADEASALFERLANEPGDRWPSLAACRLWALRIRQDRLVEAEAIFESLSNRYRFEQLAALVPAELRVRILQAYDQQTNTIELYRPNPIRIQGARHALDASLYFHEPMYELNRRRWFLIRAYQAADRREEALASCREALAEADGRVVHLPHWFATVAEQSWILIGMGRSEEALAAVDRWLFERPDVYDPRALELLASRARALASMGRWAEAEETVEELFRRRPLEELSTWHQFPSLCLLRGFLRERRGDMAGSVLAWREGAESMENRFGFEFRMSTEVFSHLILAALAGTLTNAQAEQFLNGLLASTSDHPLLGRAQMVRVPASLLRDAWLTPRGRDCARRIAYRSEPFRDHIRLPVMAIAAEFARRGAFDRDLSPAEEAQVWETVASAVPAFLENRLGQGQLIQLLLSWKGTTNFLGWGGVAPTLDPTLRGPMAYFVGHRLLRLGKPADAIRLLKSALAGAPPNSSLRRLAQADLEAIEADATFPADPFTR